MKELDGLRAAMIAATETTNAVLFGIDRTVMSHFTVDRLRIYAADLRKMTAEEIESASVGMDPAWEHWPDEPPPSFLAPQGILGWLPGR